MAVDIRCPKCNSKLRFDESPKKGDPVECPKCNNTFPAPAPPGSAGGDDQVKGLPKPKNKPKPLTQKERVHFSAPLLLLIVGSIMFTLIAGLSVTWILLARAAKAEDMLASIPDNFNVLRGVNVKAMNNYPKLKTESDKFYNGDHYSLYKEAATAVGLNPDNSVSYVIVAKESRGAASPTLLLFHTRTAFDPAKLGGGNPTQLPNNRVGAQVCCPDNKLIAIAYGGNDQATLSAVATNYRKKPADGMHTKVGTAGLMAIRGHLWTIIRPTGGLTQYLAESAATLKDDSNLKVLRESLANAKVLCTWTSFGGQGVRFGAALGLADSNAAKELVKDMKSGPLGKGDESEPPNNFKTQMNFVTQQKEFLQYLEYRSSGDCAYIISKIENPEKARPALEVFNNAYRGRSGGGNPGDALRGP